MAPTTRLVAKRYARPLGGRREVLENMSTSQTPSPIFAIRTIPGRGRGLFALIDIAQGTRIATEAPFFTLPNIDSLNVLEVSILRRLEGLSSTQQQQFHALYNNFVGQEPPLVGIVRTNVLGINPQIDAIFPTFSFINHSCVPNAYYSGNEDVRLGSLYAIADISAGDEITIKYGDHARGHTGFQCNCQLCISSLGNRIHSDIQRDRIKVLEAQIEHRVEIQHEACLEDLREMKELLLEVYHNCPGTSLAWVYFTASQVAASQSDLARASVFAERAYRARRVCEGEDHPYVKCYKMVRDDLSLRKDYRSTDFRETGFDKVPKHLGLEEFEDWLWTWE
ncbi:hypothetical protein BKA65DRAFT_565835 [Rhexocercosporidium sp. MPI-PUGE-AT-0058]|nr:hypothetical protein BKA65DRAFT_565835 [Rhexocercosporidium sp. MPI-PUGE-AT-0058]